MSIKELAKRILIQKQNKRYGRELAKRRVSYAEWIALREREVRTEGEAENLTEGETEAPTERETKARGEDFVLLQAGEGFVAGDAIKNISRYFKENPRCMLLYGDEDIWESQRFAGGEGRSKTERGERRSPWFKPEWSPDLLDSGFYFGSLTAVRRELFERWRETLSAANGEASCPGEGSYPGEGSCPGEENRSGEELCSSGNRDRVFGEKSVSAEGVSCFRVLDFPAFQLGMFECVRLAGGYEKGLRDRVGHLERILFHGFGEGQRERLFGDNELLRRRREERVRRFAAGPGRAELLSVIVPSRDNPEILEECLRSVSTAAGELPFEAVVVDNGSGSSEKKRVEELLCALKREGMEVRYLYSPMEFNFSKMCNMGAEAAAGELLLFLNDDVKLSESGSLLELAALAGREHTGAVGMKLLYAPPMQERIQHVGITNLPMGPVHKLQSLRDGGCHDGFDRGLRNFLAVTAACLMVSREKFREAGGFPEELRVAFNDVALCFRLHELGYFNLCNNNCYAYHYESFSRGDDESEEKLERLLEERRKLYERHPGLEGVDPYYPAGLCRDGLDVRVRPAYVTSANRAQAVSVAERASLRGCRQDGCLLVRAEDFRNRRLTGWSVVLGDNNACYEKTLLLRRLPGEGGADENREEQEEIYGIPAQGILRPDLAENMPDQENVALAGFWFDFEEGAVPPGEYLVGMCAKNRVTGLKLANWTRRRVGL